MDRLGLRQSAFSASPALLSPCSSVHELVSILLSDDVNQLSFPNERGAATLFSVVIHIFQPLRRTCMPH